MIKLLKIIMYTLLIIPFIISTLLLTSANPMIGFLYFSGVILVAYLLLDLINLLGGDK